MQNDTGLKEDLIFLQTEHAIDESLIESLKTSPSQAKAHIRSYKWMICLISVMPISIGIVILTVSFFKIDGIWAFVLYLIGGWICYFFGIMLIRMCKAIIATEKVAKYHQLI